MRQFLLKNKKPICNWGNLPANTFVEGNIPKGYDLAINPTLGFIVLDIDKHGAQNGFDNIPKHIKKELKNHYSYPTKNEGAHVWLKYSGIKTLVNKTSGLGIDLRIGYNEKNNGGYVVYYPKENFRDNIQFIKETSNELNIWLESLFQYKNILEKENER